MEPLVSIITPVLNSADTIGQCMESIINQSYKNIEYIIIDGGSTDGTLDIIEQKRDRISHFKSEPDNGIYEAMNKGVRASTGYVVGILSADDCYADGSVIRSAVDTILKGYDSCYGDLQYVKRGNTEKVVRYWKSSEFSRDRFKRGWVPPHPTFFARKEIYDKYGLFNASLKISADYELMLRFLYRYRVSTAYIPKTMVKMRTGGKSTKNIRNIIKGYMECYRAWEMNGLKRSFYTILLKSMSAAPQFIRK
jgi:glycosyltransferase